MRKRSSTFQVQRSKLRTLALSRPTGEGDARIATEITKRTHFDLRCLRPVAGNAPTAITAKPEPKKISLNQR
jgi:hypothetical protein